MLRACPDRGPVGHPPPLYDSKVDTFAIFFITRDACGDSIAKLFGACFCGDSLSEAFYADAVRRVNLLTLAFALYFPAFERLRSTRSLA